MDKEIIVLVEEGAEGGYTAKALGHSIFTEGDTFDELKKNIREAVDCHFEGDDKPLMIRLHYVKDEVISA